MVGFIDDWVWLCLVVEAEPGFVVAMMVGFMVELTMKDIDC